MSLIGVAGRPDGRSPHEGLVLRTLRDEGPMSRTSLAEVTGLSIATISKVVGPLVDRGVLLETVRPSDGLGRPSKMLTPVADQVSVAAVQISVGLVRLAITDAMARVRTRDSFTTDPDTPASVVLDRIAEHLARLVSEDSGAPVVGIGVASPGRISRDQRSVRLAIGLDWHDLEVSDVLERALGIPTVVQHNVQALALTEAKYGPIGADLLAYVYVRSGVGLGIVSRHGATDFRAPEGERFLGHIQVVEDGHLCSCGARGCLESAVGEGRLRARLREIAPDLDPPTTTDVLPALHALAAAGNPLALEVERELVDYLGRGLGIVANLWNPDLLLVGGVLSSASDALLGQLRESTRSRLVPVLRDDLRLERAPGNDDAVVRSGAATALEMLHYA
ncbi:ROK family transcriptional regulator [Phycicoccus sp. BSK3Z-2]|uniref:ROK family transcriptional regulator n=1 Tax=Phycicoccus avicenniae TaxID=2828860 RepID=A0A941D8A9_9MICO|nr:ROK family transcriptional regulator [Phycicoccus avicenniae]MBR7742680.1 ROK family transcriptional regulator [Phycicoccus avicenniae]